jgi:hypothetical protein
VREGGKLTAQMKMTAGLWAMVKMNDASERCDDVNGRTRARLVRWPWVVLRARNRVDIARDGQAVITRNFTRTFLLESQISSDVCHSTTTVITLPIVHVKVAPGASGAHRNRQRWQASHWTVVRLVLTPASCRRCSRVGGVAPFSTHSLDRRCLVV